MKLKILILLVLFISINSCKSKKNLFLFDTKELNLKYKKVQKLGFKPVVGQIDILTKKEKDTTFYIAFNRFNKSNEKMWVIEFPFIDHYLIEDFLLKRQIINVTQSFELKDKEGLVFTSICQLNNRIYVCHITNNIDKRTSILSINTSRTYSNREIKKSIKYYKDIYENGLSHKMMQPELEEDEK